MAKPTITIVVDQDNLTFGDVATFTVSRDCWVHVRGWQNDVLVYEEWHPQSVEGLKAEFQHGPTSLWVSGPASCLAEARAGVDKVRGKVAYQVGV